MKFSFVLTFVLHVYIGVFEWSFQILLALSLCFDYGPMVEVDPIS